ncbi:hypothetical protein ACFVUW_11910 [Streptomyces xiamenensis]|uniref:hypothetical protein n=1 Tax=Streptomyces xiamenensis TaxID=408015 RepID=UPI0036EA706E
MPHTLLAIGATISAPPLNAALRSAWRRLVTDHADLKAVHSADSVLEEAGFVAAPLAAGTAIAVLGPVPAYCASAGAYLTVLAISVAAARRHQLIPNTAPPPPTTHSRRAHRWLGPLAQPRILLIMLPLLIMGCIFGGAGIYIPAYSQHHGLQALISTRPATAPGPTSPPQSGWWWPSPRQPPETPASPTRLLATPDRRTFLGGRFWYGLDETGRWTHRGDTPWELM